MNLSPELLLLAGASIVGNALAVCGVVRHEFALMRADRELMRREVKRAHDRIDQIPHVNFARQQ